MRIVLCALVALAATAAGARGAGGPQLVIGGIAPLVVSGTGFAAATDVTLTVTNGSRRALTRVRTNAAGTFRTRLGTFHVVSCRTLSVSARSTGGSATAIRRPSKTCGAIVALP